MFSIVCDCDRKIRQNLAFVALLNLSMSLNALIEVTSANAAAAAVRLPAGAETTIANL